MKLLNVLISFGVLSTSGCIGQNETSISNVQLEAHDTIVAFGNYRVLIPRSASCDWSVDPPLDKPNQYITMVGCVTTAPLYNMSVVTELHTNWDHVERDYRIEAVPDIQFMLNVACSINRIREGYIDDKYWVLGEGIGGMGFDTYNLLVFIKSEKYYLYLWYEISTAYFKTFVASGEIERIVNTVRLWPPDE